MAKRRRRAPPTVHTLAARWTCDDSKVHTCIVWTHTSECTVPECVAHTFTRPFLRCILHQLL